jgi:error-prone DNA polymerase
MPPGEEVVEDYRSLTLSLKAHPVSFLRGELAAHRVIRHADLGRVASNGRASVAGLVLIRQRPGSAKGVIFMTLEDETGVANIVVWPAVFERFRPIVLGARLVGVTGRVQRASGVTHVVAESLHDWSALMGRLSEGAAPQALARADEVKRPGADARGPAARPGRPHGTSMPPAAPSSAQESASRPREAAPRATQAMPKGRNFR